jgi:hypothetical protein
MVIEYRQYQCRDCTMWTSHMETSLLEREGVCSACMALRRSAGETRRAVSSYLDSWRRFHDYIDGLG